MGRQSSWAVVAASCLVVGVLGSRASAGVFGTMDLTNAAGGGVILSEASVDFALPVGPPNGSVVTGLGTALSFNGGSVGAGVSGFVLDLNLGTPLPVSDFILFPADPTLHFTLTGVGPGVANLVPSTTLDPNNPANSPFPGSPYILTPTSQGTTLTVAVFGTAQDGTSPDSTWSGVFTTQFAGRTPFDITQTLLADGTVTSSYSGDFLATVGVGGGTPEPATLSLLIGGVAVGLLRRRRRSC